MKCDLAPGTYIAAISGGVDSMVLLDVARRQPEVNLIVAHVNHGIRSDAAEDALLVRSVAMSHNLIYEETQLMLGTGASEEAARVGRYDFLRHISKKYNARAILTAHHKDDMIETALINLIRGTGWRGLSSLRSTPEIVRPLLGVSKSDLEQYARERGLPWRHDTTNDDTRYMRNRIRHTVLPHWAVEDKQKLYEIIVRQNELTEHIDNEVAVWLTEHAKMGKASVSLPRYEFTMMPENVAHEIFKVVLRRMSGKSITKPLVERMLLFLKVAKYHSHFHVNAEWQLYVLPRQVIVERRSDVVS